MKIIVSRVITSQVRSGAAMPTIDSAADLRTAHSLFAAGKIQDADVALTAAIERSETAGAAASAPLGELYLKRAQCRIILASQSRELEQSGFPIQLDHSAAWELVLVDAAQANRLVGGVAALEASAVAVDNLTLLPCSGGSGSSHELESLLHAAAADVWAMVVEDCGVEGRRRGEKAAARRDEQRMRCGPLSSPDAARLIVGLLGEPSTSAAHAAIEHVVFLTYHRLGCRVPLREWRPYHMAEGTPGEGAEQGAEQEVHALREERVVEAVIRYRLQQGRDEKWSTSRLAPGTLCRLHALEARPELNGRLGEVLSYDSAAQRYAVAVRPRGEEHEGVPLQCRVHERNLRPATAF